MKTRNRKGCAKFGLKEATRDQVVHEWSRWCASLNGDMPKERNRIVCRNLTYPTAVEYLSRINQKLLASRRMMAAFVQPFVVGWWIDGSGQEALGFPVEVWMTESEEDPGLYDIVDRSIPVYSLPWMFGLGWTKGRSWDSLA